jgi:2-polyprenyl-3-methyl-5-hydroxy-6-metoxy-1,4-benzoquinol methylase
MTEIDRNNETSKKAYTERLIRLEGVWLKKFLAPINPYKRNIRKLAIGRVLDVGCGIGRNLRYIAKLDAVGVDHNIDSVNFVRRLGYAAYIPEEFAQLDTEENTFDTLLVSHVLEHLTENEGRMLLQEYLNFVRPGGQVVLICPQEKGYSSDQTHSTYCTVETLSGLSNELGLKVVQTKSFPLPYFFGPLFIYNEHVVVAQKGITSN